MVRSQNPLFPPQTYERRPLPPRIAFSVRPARLSPFLSNCSALFRPPQFANSFAINNLRTLCTKTPGGWHRHSSLCASAFPFSTSTVLPLEHSQLQSPHSLPHSFPLVPSFEGAATGASCGPPLSSRQSATPPTPSPFFVKNIKTKDLTPGGLRRISF